MKNVAIVGVEGSGKTVLLACFGEHYKKPDENGYFLKPKDFETIAYTSSIVARLHEGVWPSATAEDSFVDLSWQLWHSDGPKAPATQQGEISFFDFAGEVYRKAYGAGRPKDKQLSADVKKLKSTVGNATIVIVLVNLADIIQHGLNDRRNIEAVWITGAILDSLSSYQRVAIVLSQADSYRDTIQACGGEMEVLRKYLPTMAAQHGQLEVFSISAIDKTVLDDEGRLVPAKDFSTNGLKPLMDWILTVNEEMRLAEEKRWVEAEERKREQDKTDKWICAASITLSILLQTWLLWKAYTAAGWFMTLVFFLLFLVPPTGVSLIFYRIVDEACNLRPVLEAGIVIVWIATVLLLLIRIVIAFV